MASSERWETGNGDGSGVYLVTPGQAGHVKIGDFGEGGRAPGGSEAAVKRAHLAASAPDMHRALVEAADTIEWLAPAKGDCKCSGQFQCVAHSGLAIVRAALAKVGVR